jgi:hypothetical protein
MFCVLQMSLSSCFEQTLNQPCGGCCADAGIVAEASRANAPAMADAAAIVLVLDMINRFLSTL